ncbi:platelet-derived growth factor receptor-like protein [Paramormyrops kingsleyae]|uniref:Platelet-derived growth factor receptor-like protein n=1 Tax=Paramormyrops kingsleyae TaxID=1676925 RepID=A0A3B3RUL0_9TELE|nr:platelet-derived growth factor receptor-like protein [Paramormyrops kingsleyae]
MKLWLLVALLLLWSQLENGLCQDFRRRKDSNESRGKLIGKRVKGRPPKLKERDPQGRGGTLLTQVLDKGRFLRLGDSLTVPAGKDLELRCKGSRVGWTYPTYLDRFNESRLSIKQQDKFSQLMLTSPSAADTGEYSCWVVLCDGAECEKDPDRTSSTYIYFADKDELFVPSMVYTEIVYLRPDRPAVVPCRVTTPHTRVTLHREVPPGEVSASYKPTSGFLITDPMPEHMGVVYCKATAKGTMQISNKYQLLYVEVPSGPPFATIEASATSVRGGDNVNITCTVLGEPELDVDFTWTYPGQDQRPVDIYGAWRLIARGVGHTTRISQSVLMLEDMETIDFGRYTCRAKNRHGETSVATRLEPL